jgi:ABC-type transport system substrate-binding protein
MIPSTVPGFRAITRDQIRLRATVLGARPRLTLAYATQDRHATAYAKQIKRYAKAVATVRITPATNLAAIAGPPPRADLVLLGWSGEFFDAYNFYDQFACSSALNVAQWCDRGFDALMHRAVRTLPAKTRYGIERQIEGTLEDRYPAVALANAKAYVLLKPGVRGFEWSPIGFWDLRRVRRG